MQARSSRFSATVNTTEATMLIRQPEVLTLMGRPFNMRDGRLRANAGSLLRPVSSRRYRRDSAPMAATVLLLLYQAPRAASALLRLIRFAMPINNGRTYRYITTAMSATTHANTVGNMAPNVKVIATTKPSTYSAR